MAILSVTDRPLRVLVLVSAIGQEEASAEARREARDAGWRVRTVCRSWPDGIGLPAIDRMLWRVELAARKRED